MLIATDRATAAARTLDAAGELADARCAVVVASDGDVENDAELVGSFGAVSACAIVAKGRATAKESHERMTALRHCQ